MKKVLQQLRKFNLFAKAEKCEFFVDHTKFLGYDITHGSIKMSQDKLQAIHDWPAPTNVRQVRGFLGFCNFYRHFILNYAHIARPLHKLTQQNRKWNWDKEEQDAFEQLKHAFTQAPILQHFDPDLPITVEADASNFAIGAILLQPDKDGNLHPVAYHSRKLNSAELNYSTHDKEMLAIIDAFKTWRHYLIGSDQVIIYTDHHSLEYFMQKHTWNRRQNRWLEFMQAFQFNIKWKKGVTNMKADALSRRPDYQLDPTTHPSPTAFFHPSQLPTNAARTTRQRKPPQPSPPPEPPTPAPPPDTDSSEDDTAPGISPLLAKIQECQETHESTQELIHLLKDHTLPVPEDLNHDINLFELDPAGLLRFSNIIYIPNDFQLKLHVLAFIHNSRAGGHLGIDKTTDMFARHFYFPGMEKFIKEYVRGCYTCQRDKPVNRRRYGPLRPLPIPTVPWRSISMDALTKLPPSGPLGHNAVWVFVCRLTKMAVFLLYTEKDFTAERLAELFYHDIWKNYGLPHDIVSDRGSLNTSKYWRAFLKMLSIQPLFSTAFHPQTDGQTERIIQNLTTYLRHFVSAYQDDWFNLLPPHSLPTTTQSTPAPR